MSFDEEPEDIHGECRHEIERLTAKLAQAQAELREMLKDLKRWEQRAEAAEAKNLSLAAQVAAMANTLQLIAFHRDAGASGLPQRWARNAIANLPAEAEKLLRVVEAAKEHKKKHTQEKYEERCPICKAIRDLQDKK